MATKMPTFDDLLSRVRQPNKLTVGDLTGEGKPQQFDAAGAASLGYSLPSGWKLSRTTMNGVNSDSLISPRGHTFKGVTANPDGSVGFSTVHDAAGNDLSTLYGLGNGVDLGGKPVASATGNEKPAGFKPVSMANERVASALGPKNLNAAMSPPITATTPGGNEFTFTPSQEELSLMTQPERIAYQNDPQQWYADRAGWEKIRQTRPILRRAGEAALATGLGAATGGVAGAAMAGGLGGALGMVPENAGNYSMRYDQMSGPDLVNRLKDEGLFAANLAAFTYPMPGLKTGGEAFMRAVDKVSPQIADAVRALGDKATQSDVYRAVNNFLHTPVFEKALADETGSLGGQKAIDAAIQEARRAASTFTTPGEYDTAMHEIQQELGLRSMPYHGGEPAGAYQGYTSKQLDAMLNEYQTARDSAFPTAERAASQEAGAEATQTATEQPIRQAEPTGTGGGENVPPAGETAAATAPNPEGTPIERLTKMIKEAQPARKETEQLKHAELSRRAAVVEQMVKSGEGRQGIVKAKGALVGQLPQADYAVDLAKYNLNDAEINSLFNMIRDNPKFEGRAFKYINSEAALSKVLIGQIPTYGEMSLLEDTFGKEFVNALLSKRSLSGKIWDEVASALNLPRAVLTAYDLSAPLRQGILFVGQPKEVWSATKGMVHSLFSEKFAKALQEAIDSSPFAKLREDAGLYLAPVDRASARLSEREEAYMSKLAEKIPGIRASERAYIMYLNKLRADVFDSYAKAWGPENRPMDDFKQLASFINHMTGRGDLPAFAKEWGAGLNATFFAPRYMISRFQVPADLLTKPAIRKIAARNLAAFVGLGLTALGLIKLAGGTVETDPRSSDFGKGKIGATRLDFWGGYQQYARYIVQIMTSQRKNLTSGNVMPAKRIDTAAQLLRSKTAPFPGLVWTLLAGSNAVGQKVSGNPKAVGQQVYQDLTPMFVQDTIDAVTEQGLAAGLPLAIPGAFGVGVQTFGGKEDAQASVNLVKTGLAAMGQPDPNRTNAIYDTTSLKRDIAKASQSVSAEFQNTETGFPAVADYYWQISDQEKQYSATPESQQSAYLANNPDFLAGRIFWGYQTSIPDLATAQAVKALADHYGVPINLIPAFEQTDSGHDRMPPESLWEAYFTYNALDKPDGSADTAARLAFRKANPDFNQWGIDNLPWRPLGGSTTGPTATAAPARPAGGVSGGISSGSFSTVSSPQSTAVKRVSFPRARRSLRVRAPGAPRV